MDRLFLGVIRLGKAAQKHCRSGDVSGQPERTVGIVPPIHDVVLDLAGVTSGTARRVTRTGRIVVRRVR